MKIILQHSTPVLIPSKKKLPLLLQNKYKFLKGNTALLELCFALLKFDCIVQVNDEPVIMKYFVEDLFAFFGLYIEWVNSKINDLENRERKTSVFLNKLLVAFEKAVID